MSMKAAGISPSSSSNVFVRILTWAPAIGSFEDAFAFPLRRSPIESGPGSIKIEQAWGAFFAACFRASRLGIGYCAR
jgi:hypothetical protein